MAISRRATATATNATSNAVLSPAWDVTPSNGDLLLAVIAGIVQVSITPPAGWTLLGTQDSGTTLRSWMYSRTAASEPASNTWTLASTTKCWAWCGAYAGVDVSTLVHGRTTGLTTPSLAVPANGWLVSAAAGRHSNTGAPSTWTSSDGLDSERLDFGSNVSSSQDVAGAVYDSNRALAAGSYTRTLSSSNTESQSVAEAFAFGPTVAPAPSTGARWGVHV